MYVRCSKVAPVRALKQHHQLLVLINRSQDRQWITDSYPLARDPLCITDDPRCNHST